MAQGAAIQPAKSDAKDDVVLSAMRDELERSKSQIAGGGVGADESRVRLIAAAYEAVLCKGFLRHSHLESLSKSFA